VYGPRDFGRVISLWLDWAAAGRDLVIYGGEQVIDFVWVGQVVEALERATTANIVGLPINIGSGVGTPLLHLAERILQLSGSQSKLDRHPARTVEVSRFIANVQRMETLLDLHPPVDALDRLHELWRAYAQGAHPPAPRLAP
jgi:nucleoside-diphosphate-sugar epimerase